MMRKLVMFNMMSLDGFFEGEDGDINWHVVDDEFNDFAIAQLDTVDALIFGRRTYELMASYWPTQDALTNDPLVADKMNHLPKIVFSRTLTKADWGNTRLVKENLAEEFTALKQQPGKDIIIFGSADLASTLNKHGMIDEYRVMVNPIVLGSGKPLFHGIHEKLHLKLINTRTFASGNVLLYYQKSM